jgi:hypothetical protein
MISESAVPTPGASPQPDTEATEPAIPSPVPSLAPDKGGAVGQFIDYISDKPIAQTTFYLGELLSPATGEDTDSPFVMMVPSTSPSFVTDEEGRFAILNVKPATYAIVFWTPRESRVVTDLETDESVLVTFEAGEIIDLDIVRIGLPH